MKNKNVKYKLNQLIVFKEDENSEYKIGIENEKETIQDVLDSDLTFYERKNLSYVKNLRDFIENLDEALTLIGKNKYFANFEYEYTVKQLPKVLKKVKKIEEFNKQNREEI